MKRAYALRLRCSGCDRHAWHVLARHVIERAVWSATSTEEAVRDGRPLPWNPNLFNQHDR